MVSLIGGLVFFGEFGVVFNEDVLNEVNTEGTVRGGGDVRCNVDISNGAGGVEHKQVPAKCVRLIR